MDRWRTKTSVRALGSPLRVETKGKPAGLKCEKEKGLERYIRYPPIIIITRVTTPLPRGTWEKREEKKAHITFSCQYNYSPNSLYKNSL